MELVSQTEVEDDELQISRRSKTSKKQEKSKTKANKNRNKVQDDPTSVLLSLSNVEPEDSGELPASKRRKSSEEESMRLKKKKSKKSLC